MQPQPVGSAMYEYERRRCGLGGNETKCRAAPYQKVSRLVMIVTDASSQFCETARKSRFAELGFDSQAFGGAWGSIHLVSAGNCSCSMAIDGTPYSTSCIRDTSIMFLLRTAVQI